jgi:hypothetical protein
VINTAISETVKLPVDKTFKVAKSFRIVFIVYIVFMNISKIIHEENTKKNHKRVVSLYVDKDFPSFT